MLDWNQLHHNLEAASKRHQRLVEKFGQFASSVEALVSDPNFHIKGVGVSLNLDQGYFSTNFAGRTLDFRFESTPGEHASLVGKITCYRKTDFPMVVIASIGDFIFNGSGETTLRDPVLNESISIDDDVGRLHIVLNYFQASLSV